MHHRHLRVALAALLAAAILPPVHAEVITEKLADHVGLFYADAKAKESALPSVALVVERKGAATDSGVTLHPEFLTADGKPAAQLTIAPGTSLYGTGEIAGTLLRSGQSSIAWNTDAYNYKATTPSLYQSHPWVLGVLANGHAFGVLADSTYRVKMDLPPTSGGELRFTSDGPQFPVIVIERDSPQEVVKELAELTGKMPLPPRWALGFQQCRFSYTPDSRVREVAGEFRKRKIPCDVIWMDIDYMDGYRCFTFSPKDFPDPTKLNADLHGMGFHAVWMIDPGIKDEAGYSVHDSGTAADVWVKAADGKANFAGKVWPGMCLFPDFTMKATRAWWAGLYKNFLATGVDGVWNDMNEPAVFELKGHTMPEDNFHRADPELGGTAPHSRYHNIYGMQMVRATREGILAARPDKRPFVLSRANYLGGQRYAAAWTGDNAADWAHLRDSIPMALNLGLSGQPFAGPDIGGYKGNGPKDQEGRFFARWMGIGSLLPFARAHTEKGSINKEPWAFGPEVEDTCRAAIERRYRLMPYLYTLFREASVSGMPVARPLFFADPADEELRDQDTSFLLGGDLLVQARIGEQSQWPAVMPKGAWRDLWQVSGPRGDDLPRLFIRAGAIIPSRDVTQYTAEKPLEELRLIINLGPDKKASGAFYDDAGDGFAYQKGDYRLSTFTAELKGDELVVREQSHEGERPKAWKRLIVESPGAAPWKSVRIEE